MPAPAISAWTLAPRAAACSAVSSTMMPAPSPRTNPSRPLSNGRDARSGPSLRVDSARICAKPAIGSWCTTASVPPATTTSARPSRIRSAASASASAPLAQALTVACTPALAPNSSPSAAPGPFGMSIGTVSGDTRRTPRSSRMSSWLSMVTAPPMPLPTTIASRSGSTPRTRPSGTPSLVLGTGSKPASAHASRPATRAACWQRSSRRASTRSSTAVGSTAIRATRRAGKSRAHSSVSAVTPERPESSPSQVDATSPPSGVVAPSPVTTTVGRPVTVPAPPTCRRARAPGGRPSSLPARAASTRARSRRGPGLGDVADGVADRLEVGQLVVRDLHVEALLGGQRDLDHGQGVDVEVVGERLVLAHVGGQHPGDLLQDLGQAVADLLVRHCVSFGSVSGGSCGWSGAEDDLTRVRQPGTEAEQQHWVAGAHLSTRRHPGERERDRGRGGVPGLDYVIRHQDVRCAELASDRLDDAQVRLVRDERRQLGRLDAGLPAGLQRDRSEGGGRPPEDRLAFLPEVRRAVGDPDQLGLVAGAAPDHRADADLLRGLGRADQDRAGSVGEDDRGGPVVLVHPVGQLLRADQQHPAGGAGGDRGGGRGQAVDEAGAGAVEVVRAGGGDPEPAGHRGGRMRDGARHRAGRDDHQVNVGGGQAAGGQRLAAGADRHVNHRLVRAGDPAAGDADPAADPLVVGVHPLGQLGVGHHPGRLVLSQGQEPGAGQCGPDVHRDSSPVPGTSRASGSPGSTRSPSCSSHSTSTPSYPALTWRSSFFVRTAPSLLPARTQVPSAMPSVLKVPPAGATTTRQSGVCSPCPPAAARATRARAAGRSSGVRSLTVSTPGSSRRASPASVPAGGSSMIALTPRWRRVAWQRSQRTERMSWPTSRCTTSAPLSTAVPSALDSSIRCGSAAGRPAASAPNASRAGSM